MKNRSRMDEWWGHRGNSPSFSLCVRKVATKVGILQAFGKDFVYGKVFCSSFQMNFSWEFFGVSLACVYKWTRSLLADDGSMKRTKTSTNNNQQKVWTFMNLLNVLSKFYIMKLRNAKRMNAQNEKFDCKTFLRIFRFELTIIRTLLLLGKCCWMKVAWK